VDGLADEVVCAAAQRRDGVLDDDRARDHDDHGLGLAALYLAQGVEPRAVREVYVEQDGRRLLGLEDSDAGGDRAGLGRLIAPALERLGQRPADGRVVIDDQNLFLALFQKTPPEVPLVRFLDRCGNYSSQPMRTEPRAWASVGERVVLW